MISKDRLIAITDGIIAVAATIMVMRLDIPEQINAQAIAQRLPILIAYIISFLQIFLAWHEHHDAFYHVEKIDHRVFLLNCGWLFFITMLPYATGLVGQNIQDPKAVLIYIIVLLAQQILITLESGVVNKLNRTQMMDHGIIRTLRIITFIGYALAAACILIAPRIGFAVVVVMSILNIILVIHYDITHTDKES